MTNEEIKNKLLRLYKCENDFTVTQTGKESKKVNGIYKPATHEIFLHNKNFKNDNQLVFTAIHELTHHILDADKGIKGRNSHPAIFWTTFYDLLDKAEKEGIYSRVRNEKTAALVIEAKALQQEIIKAQTAFGKVLERIIKEAPENGDRSEDVITHDLQLSAKKAKQIMNMNGEYSDEVTQIINSAKSDESADEVLKIADNGGTIEQMKAAAKKAKPVDDGLESPESLSKEKKYLEHKIDQLQDRLVQVEETLASMTDRLD